MDKEPFKIAVPDAVLSDLRERLSRARYPIDFANENWMYGTNRVYLEELVAYWRDQYDWRKHEVEINRFAIGQRSTEFQFISSMSRAKVLDRSR